MTLAIAICGFVYQFTEEGSDSEKLVYCMEAVLIAVLTVLWCHYDAALHGVRVPRWLGILTFLVIPLGLPIYLLRRNRATALAGMIRAVIFGLVLVAVDYVISEITWQLLIAETA